MKSLRINLSTWIRPVRLFLASCVCALLLFSYAYPAYSATKTTAPKSDLTEGEAHLTTIEKKSAEAVLSDPYGMRKEQAESNPGLNVDQGDADKDKMKTPETSKGFESIEQKVEKALEKVTDNR